MLAPRLRNLNTVSIALHLDDLEIINWCFVIYVFLVEDKGFYEKLKEKLNEDIIVFFRSIDELLVASAIFVKILNRVDT